MFKSLSKLIEEGDIASIRNLIAERVDINEPLSDGELPISKAIKMLFKRDVVVSQSKSTLFLEIIDLWIANGAAVNQLVINSVPLYIYLCQHIVQRHHEFFESSVSTEYEVRCETIICILIKKFASLPCPPDINARDAHLRTPLLESISRGSEKISALFLSLGADLTLVNSSSKSVLHVACEKGSLPLVSILLKANADLINIEDEQRKTPLDCTQNCDIILFLFNHAARSNFRDLLYYFRLAQYHKHELLLDYLLNHDLAAYRDQKGYCALHFCDSLAIARSLISKGAVNGLDSQAMFRLTSLMFNYKKRGEEIAYLELLQQSGFDFSIRDKETQNTVLHELVYFGVDVIETLLRYGVDLNAKNAQGQTILHLATQGGLLNEMALFLDRKINLHARDIHDEIALEKIEVMQFRHPDTFSPNICVDVMNRLLASHPENAEIKNGVELLLLAVYCESLPLIQVLYKRGVSLTHTKNSQKISAIELAAVQNKVALLRWMLTVINIEENRDILNEALGRAVDSCYDAIVEVLLASGIDINWRNAAQQSLLVIFSSSLFHLYPYRTEEEKSEASIRTLSVLLNHNITLSTALLEELIVYGQRLWPIIAVMLSHKVSIPVERDQVIQLVEWASAYCDLASLKYILETPVAKSIYQDLLTCAASIAIKNLDKKLLDQLLDWHLDVNHPLFAYRMVGRYRYLLDEVIHLRGCNRQVQEAWIIYLIERGARLHVPVQRRSLLHWAVEQDCRHLIARLLEEGSGFSIDILENEITPLQLAVKGGNRHLVDFFLANGANPNKLDKENKTLLYLACENGFLDLIPSLLKSNIDKNAVTTYGSRAVDVATFYQDKSVSEKMLQYLLDAEVLIDGRLLHLMIHQNISEHLLQKVFPALTEGDIDSGMLFDTIKLNNLTACQMIIDKYPKFLQGRDHHGRSLLHLATAPYKKSLFEYLRYQRADINACDYEGYDITTYAIFHGTVRELGLTPKSNVNIPEITQLYAKLIATPEFEKADEGGRFLLSTYCYKFIFIFETASNALAFILKHGAKQARCPVHDLSQFYLPTQIPHRSHWIALLFECGIDIMPLIHLAPRVETLLQRAPSNLEELKQLAQTIKYNRELENTELAEIFNRYHLPEIVFNRTLDAYRPKPQCYLPDIAIDGNAFDMPQYYLKKLTDHDLRGFVLGAMTHCCQSAGSQGEGCAVHGMTSVYGGFYAVFKRNQKDITRIETLIESANHATNLEAFLGLLKVKAQREKYQKICASLNSIDELRRMLNHELVLLREGELIAQMWSWISQNNAVVLDSWEPLRDEDDHLCPLFINRLADKILQTRLDIDKVLLGVNGGTPQNLPYDIVNTADTPRDYVGYRDSRRQYLIRSRAPEMTNDKHAKALIANSSLFPARPSLFSLQPYSTEKMDAMLNRYFCGKNWVTLLPSLDLRHVEKERIRESIQLLGTLSIMNENDISRFNILPIYTKEMVWTAFILEHGKARYQNENKPWSVLSYLDLSLHPIPQELTELNVEPLTFPGLYNVNQVPLVYQNDPLLSGVWLLEILHQFSITKVLSVPLMIEDANKLVQEQFSFDSSDTAISAVL